MCVHYMHNVCTITPNPVLLVARHCAHYEQSDARGEVLICAGQFYLYKLGNRSFCVMPNVRKSAENAFTEVF
jgi:hypothetical protein